MNIDLGSFAFGSSLESGGGTPSWGTALGQSSPDYKFSYPGCEAILIGMVYCSVPLDNVRLPIGKGGRVYVASNRNECQLASLFRKVFINGIKIDYPFIMVLMKEESDSHPGRKGIKYSDKIEYEDDTYHYSNQEFINRARLTLNMDEGACWFVYKIEVHNQDELHLFAVIVDSEDNVVYENSSKRRNSWLELIPDVENELEAFSHDTSFEDNTILQQIFYGAPGTGKSHRIKEIIKEHGIDEKEQVIRTTFHPDSDYSTFVGCYKPIMKKVPQTYVVEGNEKPVMADKDNQATKDEIVYDYTPQAFVQAYTKAWTNPGKSIILVIEEINRGNCAQIFGDIFQLLDRGNDGVSEYKIKPDKALEDYLKGYFEGYPDVEIRDEIRTGESMKLPANLYIWATMNTSDQSLFPIDSAFKRRWEWKYLPINNHEDKNYKIEIGSIKYDWWGFLSKINQVIGDTTSSEDKKLGYFFAKANDSGIVTAEQFVGKVLFYLWNDVFKNYGFDNQIFDKGDKKKFDFSEFFKQDGSPHTEMMNMFLGKLDETIDKENSFVEKPKDENGQGE